MGTKPKHELTHIPYMHDMLPEGNFLDTLPWYLHFDHEPSNEVRYRISPFVISSPH